MSAPFALVRGQCAACARPPEPYLEGVLSKTKSWENILCQSQTIRESRAFSMCWGSPTHAPGFGQYALAMRPKSACLPSRASLARGDKGKELMVLVYPNSTPPPIRRMSDGTRRPLFVNCHPAPLRTVKAKHWFKSNFLRLGIGLGMNVVNQCARRTPGFAAALD